MSDAFDSVTYRTARESVPMAAGFIGLGALQFLWAPIWSANGMAGMGAILGGMMFVWLALRTRVEIGAGTVRIRQLFGEVVLNRSDGAKVRSVSILPGFPRSGRGLTISTDTDKSVTISLQLFSKADQTSLEADIKRELLETT
ncbi:MAG: hypothetical protein GY925_01765 [Actinomycetia bacterium]|nr:hypothetical protein [Actinomycetes bacterium]